MNAVENILLIAILFVIVILGASVIVPRFNRWRLLSSLEVPSLDLIKKKGDLAKEFVRKISSTKGPVLYADYTGWYTDWDSKEDHCCKPMLDMKVYLGSDDASGNEAMYSTLERAKDNTSKRVTVAVCSMSDCGYIRLIPVYPREGGYSISDGGAHG